MLSVRLVAATLGLALVGSAVAPGVAWANEEDDEASPEMPMGLMEGVVGESMGREGSGTSWRPDTTPVHGVMAMSHGWMLMGHGTLNLVLEDMVGPRGGQNSFSTNWVMGMARHELARGQLTVRMMFSAEAMTVPAQGYPELLQTGETYDGAAIHDRQHPHNIFMEVAADYARELAAGIAVEAYLAPVGEPALGPTAFMHRESADPNPLAPITHHHLDSTHVSFGVATLALYNRWLKLEGSAFNGREPGQDRGAFPLDSLDSWSVRAQVSPWKNLVTQVSYGHLASPEAQLPGVSQQRVTASATLNLPLADVGNWATTAAWGWTREGATGTHAALLETAARLDGHNTVFGRFEWVQRTVEDLDLPSSLPAGLYDVSQVTLGYLRELDAIAGLQPGLGAQGMLSFVPTPLEHLYGGSAAPGVLALVRVRLVQPGS
jgi:hypothetical protein